MLLDADNGAEKELSRQYLWGCGECFLHTLLTRQALNHMAGTARAATGRRQAPQDLLVPLCSQWQREKRII